MEIKAKLPSDEEENSLFSEHNAFQNATIPFSSQQFKSRTHGEKTNTTTSRRSLFFAPAIPSIGIIFSATATAVEEASGTNKLQLHLLTARCLVATSRWADCITVIHAAGIGSVNNAANNDTANDPTNMNTNKPTRSPNPTDPSLIPHRTYRRQHHRRPR